MGAKTPRGPRRPTPRGPRRPIRGGRGPRRDPYTPGKGRGGEGGGRRDPRGPFLGGRGPRRDPRRPIRGGRGPRRDPYTPGEGRGGAGMPVLNPIRDFNERRLDYIGRGNLGGRPGQRPGDGYQVPVVRPGDDRRLDEGLQVPVVRPSPSPIEERYEKNKDNKILDNPLNAPGYGLRVDNPFGIYTADFRDSDGDGVDDRDQRGPGQPKFKFGKEVQGGLRPDGTLSGSSGGTRPSQKGSDNYFDRDRFEQALKGDVTLSRNERGNIEATPTGGIRPSQKGSDDYFDRDRFEQVLKGDVTLSRNERGNIEATPSEKEKAFSERIEAISKEDTPKADGDSTFFTEDELKQGRKDNPKASVPARGDGDSTFFTLEERDQGRQEQERAGKFAEYMGMMRDEKPKKGKRKSKSSFAGKKLRGRGRGLRV